MDKCPYCERKFKQITDFPKVKAVSAGLFDDDQVARELDVKYGLSHRDIQTKLSGEISRLMKSNDAVKKFSKTLDDAVGEEIRIEDLLPDWVFSAAIAIPGAENYKITFVEAKSKKESRITELFLFKADEGVYKQLLKIGRIKYEGLVNH